jgi:hypothetical protein
VPNTRLDLRTRARTRADQDNAAFPTDTQYNAYLDEACREVLADLVMAGWPLDHSTTTIVTNGVTQTYAFGGTDNVLAAKMVYTNFGNQFTELRRVNPGHVAALRSTGATGGFSRFYEVRVNPTTGNIIEFFPRVAGTYFVDYVVDWPGFASDGGNPVWMGPSRSDELVTLRAAAKGCRKEGRQADADRLDKEYDRLLLKVTSLASAYDMRNAAEMRDSRPLAEPFSFRDVDYFAGPGGMF